MGGQPDVIQKKPQHNEIRMEIEHFVLEYFQVLPHVVADDPEIQHLDRMPAAVEKPLQPVDVGFLGIHRHAKREGVPYDCNPGNPWRLLPAAFNVAHPGGVDPD